MYFTQLRRITHEFNTMFFMLEERTAMCKQELISKIPGRTEY